QIEIEPSAAPAPIMSAMSNDETMGFVFRHAAWPESRLAARSGPMSGSSFRISGPWGWPVNASLSGLNNPLPLAPVLAEIAADHSLQVASENGGAGNSSRAAAAKFASSITGSTGPATTVHQMRASFSTSILSRTASQN